MNQQNDRVIKVKNVFAYIRKYIALVIVLALCGAVGLAGLCYLKNKREIDAEQSQTPVKLEDMYEEFSETEKADISYALYSYDRMAEMEQYLDESLYMQIEPYHMQQKTYQFQIKLDVTLDTVEERTEAQNQILSAYIAYIRNGGLADSVAESKELKGDYTAAQIKELLDVSYDSAMQTNGGLCLYVYGTNLVPGLDELAKETLIQYAGELKNVQKHTLVMTDTQTAVVRSDTVYNVQRTIYTERVNTKDRLKNAVDALSGNTLTYYNGIVEDEKEQALKEEKLEETGTTADAVPAPHVDKKKLIKYGLVGGVLGAAGSIVILLLCFMYSKVIVADTDYTLTMGMKLLGNISESEMQEQLGFVVAKILAACKKKEITKLALISSDMRNISENMQEDLVKKLEKQGIQLDVLAEIVTDSEAMSKLFAEGAAVMIEKKGVSLYQRVYDMVDLCVENEVSILGVIDTRK